MNKVTVLMPVYNSEQYLREAIDSILNQTFKDFEFLIINDGSTDKSLEIIKSYEDDRIKLETIKHTGIVGALNRGLDLAQGEYIARMDADDVSVPTRLEKQVKYMEDHPEVGVCGAWLKIFAKNKNIGMVIEKPSESVSIKKEMVFRNVIQHPTAMLRKNLFNKYKLRYRLDYIHTEDYDLWVRASKYFSLANIPEVLVLYRYHPGSITNTHAQIQQENVRKIRQKLWGELSFCLNKEQILILQQVCDLSFTPSLSFLEQAENVLLALPAKYKELVSRQWFLVCSRSASLGLLIWGIYWRSSISQKYVLNLREKWSFRIRSFCKIDARKFLRLSGRLLARF